MTNLNSIGIIFIFAVCCIFSYLLGSVNFAIVFSKVIYKQDVRSFGSGNAGMTNMLRTFGKRAAVITLLGDVSKGIIAVLASRLIGQFIAPDYILYMLHASAMCALLGHVYPLFFKFKGGKAILVSTGAIISINPILIPPLLAVFLIAFFSTKMVSAGSIASAIAYPIFTAAYYAIVGQVSVVALIGSSAMGLLVLYLHRANIKRIINGTEYKFMQKKSESSDDTDDINDEQK